MVYMVTAFLLAKIWTKINDQNALYLSCELVAEPAKASGQWASMGSSPGPSFFPFFAKILNFYFAKNSWKRFETFFPYIIALLGQKSQV